MLPLQKFVDKLGPVISAAWLNAVDLVQASFTSDGNGNVTANTSLTTPTANITSNLAAGAITTNLLTVGNPAGVTLTAAGAIGAAGNITAAQVTTPLIVAPPLAQLILNNMLQLTNTAIQGFGPTAQQYLDMTVDQGQFSMAFSGLTGGPAVTSWMKFGPMAMVYVPAILGPSVNNTFALSTLPPEITPINNQVISVPDGIVLNNGVPLSTVCAEVTTTGTIVMFNNGAPNTWAVPGTKGFNFVTVLGPWLVTL